MMNDGVELAKPAHGARSLVFLVPFALLTLAAALILGSCQSTERGSEIPEFLKPLAEGQDPELWRLEHPDIVSPLPYKGKYLFFFAANKGDPTPLRVYLRGDFNQWSDSEQLKRSGTALFYRLISLAEPDGMGYSFKVVDAYGDVELLDPFNRGIRYENPPRSLLRLPDSPKGRIEFYPAMKPSRLIPPRDVWIYLPPGYDKDAARRYPVLYMQDGQQVWDSKAAAHGGWKADTAQERLLAEGKVEPFIIVAIRNSSFRNPEYIGYSAYYGLPEDRVNAKIKTDGESYSDAYRSFVCDELKPFIDSRYRTKTEREFTAIAGASFGASVSLYIAFTRSDLFGIVGAFSGGNYLPDDAARRDRNFYQPYPWLIAHAVSKKDMKVYLDCGGMDVDAAFLPRTRDMIRALEEAGYREGVDLMSRIDEKAGHNEAGWATRFPACLLFFFPAQ